MHHLILLLSSGSLFELAMAAAGTDFRSDKLWDMYINWERDRGQHREVTAIFDVLLGVPTQLYSHHFDKYVRRSLVEGCISGCLLRLLSYMAFESKVFRVG